MLGGGKPGVVLRGELAEAVVMEARRNEILVISGESVSGAVARGRVDVKAEGLEAKIVRNQSGLCSAGQRESLTQETSPRKCSQQSAKIMKSAAE
jgi:hypothetical protein